MQEEEPLLNKQYSFQLQNINLSMTLKQRGVIQIEVFLKQSEKTYEVFINQQFMNQDPFLKLVYGSPKSLFANILMNVNKMQANDQGIITYTILANSKPMPVRFNSKQKKVNKEQKMLKLISQLQQNIVSLQKDQVALKQQIFQLKQKLGWMESRDKFYESNSKILSQQFKKLQNDYKELKNELEKQKNTTVEQSSAIQTLKVQQQDGNLIFFQIPQVNQTEDINGKMKMDNKQIIQTKPQKQANQKMIASINAQNSKRFETLEHLGHLKLKYLGKNYNFSGYLLPFNKLTRLQVRQTNTNGKHIYYGISTDKTKGIQSPHQHIECKSYSARDGRIWQNGNERKGGALINDGTVVTIIADLINSKIIWEADGNKLAETNLTGIMKTNKLYFIIIMVTQNDEVEILDYQGQ